MNVIAYNWAYCLYPRATLEERLSLVTTTRADAEIEEVYARYKRRGWTIIRDYSIIPHITEDPSLIRTCRRWINDKWSWSIALPTDFEHLLPPLNSLTRPLSSDPVSISGWRLFSTGDGGPAETQFQNMGGVNLFYQYVFASSAVLRSPAVKALMTITRRSNAGLGARDVRH